MFSKLQLHTTHPNPSFNSIINPPKLVEQTQQECMANITKPNGKHSNIKQPQTYNLSVYTLSPRLRWGPTGTPSLTPRVKKRKKRTPNYRKAKTQNNYGRKSVPRQPDGKAYGIQKTSRGPFSAFTNRGVDVVSHTID